MRDEEFSSNSGSKGAHGAILGIVLLIGLVAPQLYWIWVGYENVEPIQKAVWAFYLAAILGFSRQQKGKSFLFDGILWVFSNIHIPRSELFVYLYSAAFVILGLVELHKWLHI